MGFNVLTIKHKESGSRLASQPRLQGGEGVPVVGIPRRIKTMAGKRLWQLNWNLDEPGNYHLINLINN